MRISEILQILRETELKQIIIGEDDSKILSLLNLALIDVYGKFNILQEEQLIKVTEGKMRYRLQDNSQRVLQVYRHDERSEPFELPLNDINSDNSVFTPQPYILYVPKPKEGTTLSVMQSVTPPFITKANMSTVDFVIPPQLLEPIVNYCGYRAYISMNGDDQTESSSHYRRYLRSMKDVQVRGLVQYAITTNSKAVNRGFPSATGDINHAN